MLRFVTGIAGTAATEYMTEKLRESAESGARTIYLVQEQYSFEAERQIHRRLGARLALKVEVFSFKRLCDSVFRAFGGLAGVSLTKTAKYLLMSVATGEIRETLALYRKSCFDTSFLKTLVDICGEFKEAGVTCGALSRFAKDCEDEALRQKLTELALIYTAYQALIERGYSDPDDDLIRVCALLENNDFFAGAHVFVNGFTTFMAAEFELLGHVIAEADDVWFAFTSDGVFDDRRGTGVFSAAKHAMNRLSRLAASGGVGVAEPVILTELTRFSQPELQFLSEGFGRPAPGIYGGAYSDAIEIRAAAHMYHELEQVAAGISRLVREQGCRYRDIAVVARSPADFERAAQAAFSRYGIPYFTSIPEDGANTPLMRLVITALEAVRSGFAADETLLFAKSPLLGLDPEDVALLENYCYCWAIRGALWHGDFTNSPKGLAGALTEDDIAALERINSARAAVISPLLRLRESLKDADGQSFARGVFGLLEETRAAQNLTRCAEDLGGEAFLDESARIWDALMEILDIFGAVLSGYKMSVSGLCELFRLAVNSAEVSSPPQTLDQVLVGGADRIRPENLRAVFVIGANENIFPAQPAGPGVFSEAERGALINAGLEISAGLLQRSALEKYFAYFALTLPSKWLRVSFSKSDLKGHELLPSSIVTQLREMFPKLPGPALDPLEEISTPDSGFEALASRYGEDSSLTAALRNVFSAGEYSNRLARMDRAAEKPPHDIADEKTARALFGSFMRLSPSRVERFYRCPFAYFASDGLKLRARHKVEFTGLESGSVIHHVLQVMVQKHGGNGLATLSDAELSEDISQIIREYLAGLLDDPGQLPARVSFLFKRLSGTLSRLLRRLGEELAQSEFEPIAFEMPIGEGEAVEPLRLEAPDGISVAVEGTVDRVDVMNKRGQRYIRVIDYKSGVKSFVLSDVLYGLNMQMLLYLFTIAENGAGALANAIPAGVLYMPARERYITCERGADALSVERERRKQWRMNGLLIDDEEALRGMERDIAGLYIPVKLGKDGKPDASSSLASRAELGRLARKVRECVANMARQLSRGAIAACPADENGAVVCEHCDYSEICGFEPGDGTRKLKKLGRDEIFRLLAEEEDDGLD